MRTIAALATLIAGLAAAEPPRVQIAIALDTSGSMDGLIDQARTQIWDVVRFVDGFSRDGTQTRIEVALYQYGNDGIPANERHIRLEVPISTDLDALSRNLFALRTNGGSEYCGAVIAAATTGLRWSEDPRDLRMILVAGNEAFSQGPVEPMGACRVANARGIVVNTLHCGREGTVIDREWAAGAETASGAAFVIDHNQKITTPTAPQDAEIARLNQRLNQTYLPLGDDGVAAHNEQSVQDTNASRTAWNLSSRASVKASANYVCDWDLLDAMASKRIDLATIDQTRLPAAMRGMTPDERAIFVEAKRLERTAIQSQIRQLSGERDNWLANRRRESVGDASLSTAVIAGIRTQLESRGFVRRQ
jgi:hypothetical protein